MKPLLTVSAPLAFMVLLAGAAGAQQDIPLPEHPRPDFQRAGLGQPERHVAVPLRPAE